MLRISNLTFSYRGETIFSESSVILPDTGTIAIIGDNGAGKTTLLKLLARIIAPDDGTIQIPNDIAYLPQTSDNYIDKSGGERTRLLLEQIFAIPHEVLLLDEPTNNLDAEAKLWLQNQLLKHRGLSLIVSHDRSFIDQVADQILEVKSGKLTLYDGNYSDYAARLSQHYHEQTQQYAKAQKTISKLQRQLKDTQAYSHQTNHSHYNKYRDESRMAFRAKRNHAQNTAGKIIRATQTELDRLSTVERPVVRKNYQAQLSADFLRHRCLLRVENLSKTYPAKPLFSDLNFSIFTGERYRIAGGNGAGKTTLFKIIQGEITPDVGLVKLAPHLRLGYISQEVSGLDLSQNFLSQVEANPTEIFQAAATMDLTSSDLKLPCAELSRGQLTKLAFLKIVLTPVDLLILDEPTNHLDIRARENIEQALADYPGAILLATHDEQLASRLHFDQTIELCH